VSVSVSVYGGVCAQGVYGDATRIQAAGVGNGQWAVPICGRPGAQVL
jgi:hypothetical protein